jgi:MFS family permease
MTRPRPVAQLGARLRDAGLLRDRDFRRLFNSTAASQVGFHVTLLALPLVAIIALDASELAAGVLFAMLNAAFLLIGLPAGVWVDRISHRHVLIAGDLARAVLLLSVPAAWWAGLLTMWQLYVVAFLFGVCTVFFDVAYQSYLPHLVGRERLVEGNAKLEAMRAAAQVGAPGIGGQLMQALTAPVALVVNAIAMALSSILVARIEKPDPPPRHGARASLMRDILEGLRFVLSNPMLRAIAACTATANLFFSMYLAMLPFFLARDLDLGEGVIGSFVAVSGAGGILGALTAGKIASRIGAGPAIWMSIAFTAPLAMLVPWAEPGWRVWLGAAGLAVVFAGSVVFNVVQVSMRQAITPDHLLGRMNATMRFLVWGTLPLGGVFGGVLGDWLGARATLVLASVGAMLAFLPVVASPLRRVREVPASSVGEP